MGTVVPCRGKTNESGNARKLWMETADETAQEIIFNLPEEIARMLARKMKDDKMLDEAVVQRDNVYYLDHDALGKQNVNGALFLDSGISLKTRPYTYIIYGHNMKSGAMFGNLRNYENRTFYHNDPFITFDMMYETGRYVIFAAGSVSVEERGRNYVDFYALRSANVPERQAAIEALIAASVHTYPIDVQVDDQLLVLVTCVEKDEYRRVVAARRIREGEDEATLKNLVNMSRKR